MNASPWPRPSSVSLQRWFVAGVVLLFVALSIQYAFKVLEKDSASAIMRWREQLLALDGGEDVYQTSIYPNPPILALLLLPFAKMPPMVCGLTWFYLKAALTLLSLYWVFRLVESPERPFPAWAKVLTVLLSLRPIMGDLSHGNVNLFILFLVVAALYAYHQGKDVWAGLILALSIACKVTPALFIPYFLWKRSWKTLAGCAVGLGLFAWAVPASYFGPQRGTELLSSWTDKMLMPFIKKGEVYYSEHNNQSLPGLVLRLTTHSPSFTTYDEDGRLVPLQYHNFLDLTPEQARRIYTGFVVFFALVFVWAGRTPTQPRQNWRLAAEYGLIILGMLLFCERTWKHHCVTLVVPLAVLCYCLSIWWKERKMRGFLIGCLASAMLLMASTSTAKRPEWWHDFGKLAQTYGAYVWAYLILALALVVVLRRKDGILPQNTPDFNNDSTNG